MFFHPRAEVKLSDSTEEMKPDSTKTSTGNAQEVKEVTAMAFNKGKICD